MRSASLDIAISAPVLPAETLSPEETDHLSETFRLLGDPSRLRIVLACAVFAIIGNDWSVFLHFKSGKGVACGVGAFTYICFPAVLAAFLVWLVLFKWKHIVSLGSILAAPVVPIVMLVVGEPLEYVAFGALAAVIVIGKHKDNIRRLLRGEEKPISREKR